MEIIIGKYLNEDGNPLLANNVDKITGLPGVYIYEVIRIISGIPLYLEEHIARLKKSIEKAGLKYKIDSFEFKDQINLLVTMNKLDSGNVKVLIRFAEQIKSWCYFIPHAYPSDRDYKKGVSLEFLYEERINPEAKIIQSEIRDKANALIKNKDCYEVLLVDKNGFILEGSRSNVFFIKNQMIFTTPEEKVLSGITRQKVIEIIKKEKIKFSKKEIHVDTLTQMDAVFITGTSAKVLPVYKISNLKFQTDQNIIKIISDKYDQMILRYISNKKKSI